MLSDKGAPTSGRPAAEVAASGRYRVKINGVDVFAYSCAVAHYALASAGGRVRVEIESTVAFDRFAVRPLSSNIQAAAEGSRISFEAEAPCKLVVELDGDIRNPLFVLIQPPEENKPNKDGPGVRYYEGGRFHDAGEIELGSGETLYIEEGAVVSGHVVCRGSSNVRIAGRGILDGSAWRKGGKQPYELRKQMIKLIDCDNATLEGITVVDGSNWHVVPIHCRDVDIRHLNIITYEGTGDGIDVVGSSRVRIRDCFVRSNDDCVAVKATDYHDPLGLNDVEDVYVGRSVFWNAEWGNALEIGYETRCETIRNVVFEDCDIVRCEFEGHQSGGTFTIHNGDRAVVENVRYENIRVEDSLEKLFDIKIVHSKYSRDGRRGQVRDILFKDVNVVSGPFPVSIIRGFDEDHMIENVRFDNLVVHGKRIEGANEARMVAELSRNISFK